MIYNIIASGSDGNAVLINDNSFLIDIGVPYREIEPYVDTINYVFITHIHSDHFNKSTIKRLAKEKILIKFIVGSHLEEEMLKLVRKEQLFIVQPNRKYRLLNDFSISPLNLYHNVDNMGLKLEIRGLKMFYATDTYTLDGIEAVNYDYYLVERNYCEIKANEILEKARLKNSFTYVEQSMENHLSKQKLEEWLARNDRTNKGKVVYLHESSISL